MSFTFKKLLGVFKNPRKILLYMIGMGMFDFLSDKSYIKLEYRLNQKKKLNLDAPVSYSEKLQWIKLYDHNPLYTDVVDKYKVRDFVKERIGEEYLIPLLGVWDDPNEIDFDSLPDKFVLKCNHNSGKGMTICKDKSKADFDEIRSELKKGLNEDYFKVHREWPYKNVERKIICEKYMEDAETGELRDYKFFCFDGKPEILLLISERFSSETVKYDFFDMNGDPVDLFSVYKRTSDVIPKIPEDFELMKELSAELSKGFRHVRVDLYEANGKIYFGELTFFPTSGYNEMKPKKWENLLGSYINID